MQNALRKWLVGIGLLVALLALAVPAVAQNQWQKQTTPGGSGFPTPVQSIAVNPGTWVSAGTAGGAYPGGTLGNPYYSTDGGANFTMFPLTRCDLGSGDDFEAALVDGTWFYTGTWNSGLYQYNGALTNPTCGVPFVNQHVTSLAIDPGTPGTAGQPHILYYGTWGGGVYTWDGTTNVKLPGYFDPGTYPAAQWVHKIVVFPYVSNSQPLTVYAATDGYGVVRGTSINGGVTWTWSQLSGLSGDDLYVYAATYSSIGCREAFFGTKTGKVFFADDGSSSVYAYGQPSTAPIMDMTSDHACNYDFFVATWGQGIFRYDNTVTYTWHAINTGYGGANMTDPYVMSLGIDTTAYPGSTLLWAGATHDTTYTTNNLWRINLQPLIDPGNGPFTILAGTPYTYNVSLTLNPNNPGPWTATSSGLPPGLSTSVNNTGYPPVVTISGTPTTDCSYPSSTYVQDALWNTTYVPINYIVQMDVSFTWTPQPTPLGTIMTFTPTVIGAQGTVTYDWIFGDLLTTFPAYDQQVIGGGGATTHIYTAGGNYTVQLWVTDSGCGICSGVPACPATPPENCATDTATVFAPLSVNPNATMTGSGSQFQFNANALNGDQSCGPLTYAWKFYDQTNPSVILFTSTQTNPVITFAYTGTFVGEVTATDCSGNTAVGSCVVNYNGQMAATISSQANPAGDTTPAFFTVTGLGCGAAANYTLDIDYGDGSLPTLGMAPTGTTTLGAPLWNPSHPFPLMPGCNDPQQNYTVTATVHDNGAAPCTPHTTVVSMVQTIYRHFSGITVTRTNTCGPNPGGHVAQTVNFSVTPCGGFAPYLYSVNWGDGSTSSYPNTPGGAFNFSHTYTTAGIYNITVYGTDSGALPVTKSTTNGSFTLGNITTGRLDVNGPYQCAQISTLQPAQFVLNNTTLLSAGIVAADFTYDLDYGDGTAHYVGAFAGATQVVPPKLYALPIGYNSWDYTATLTVHNNITCENHVSTAIIHVYAPLAPLSAPSWYQECGNRTVHFSTSVPTTGVPPYTYIWDFGDATPPISTATPSATHTYATTGSYSAQLTVLDSAMPHCTTVLSNTVNKIFVIQVVDPIVDVVISGTPDTGCAPLSVTFTTTAAGGGDPGTALAYYWDFGDGGNSALASPTHIYTTPGTYNAQLTVNSTVVPSYVCYSNIFTITVYGGMTPGSMSFTQTETSGYLPLNDTFTTTWMMTGPPNSPVTLTYNWGDGTSNDVVNNAVSPDYTQHTFEKASGALGWLVTVTATDTCGNSQTFSRRIVILEPPVLTVTTSATPSAGISPLTVVFASNPAGGVSPYSYAWTFGDGGTSTQQNPTHIYATANTYTATLTVTDSYPVFGGGPHTASATVTVTVYDPLVVNATGTPTSGSTPLTVNFNAAATGGSAVKTYFWYFGDGSNSALQNPVHVYNTAGTYFAYVVVSDDASHVATSNQVIVNVYDPLVVTANATPSAGINPLAVTFNASANGGDHNYTYAWTYGDGGTGSGALVNHTYTTAGTYTATVTVTDGVGHTANQTVTVLVYDPLTVSITGTPVGGGDYTPKTYNFASTVNGGNHVYTYSWNFGDGGTSAAANPSHIFTAAGSFAVTLIVTDTASHAATSNTINLTVYTPLAVSASATPSTHVIGQSVTFNAIATGGDGHYSYAWTFGDGGTGTGATVNHTYAAIGTYSAHVVVTDTASHSVTSSNITINVMPVPPHITIAQKLHNPFRIRLLGDNFQSGCTATIDGTPVTVSFKNGGKIVLKNCKALCPKGVAVTIVVTNPDGGVSDPFMFVR